MMKTEKTKKAWLWWLIGIVAVLAAAAVCLVLFLKPAVPGGEQAQPQDDAAVSSKLYWNVDMVAYTENSETGLSTREPDEKGVFTIRFLCDGQIIELQTIDRQIVNYIDTLQLMGLVFDESGFIVDAVNPKEVAKELAKEVFVKVSADGRLELNSSMAMNGMVMEFAITDAVYFMDVRPDAPELGANVPLEVMDKVTVYGDAEGNPTYVYFLERQPTAGVYIRIGKQWDSVNSCTARVPDENGVYTIKMAHEGQQVEMKCKIKDVVTVIDSGDDANQFKGLYLDEEGYITKAVSVPVAIRGLLKCNVYHVTAIEGNTVTTERLLFHDGRVETFQMDETTKIFSSDSSTYNAFDYIGQPVESLQLNDRVIVFTDVFGTAKYIFLTKRLVDVPLYYNKTVMFDGKKQETTRPKDKNGYYVFEMGNEGKTVKLKTKDKKLASQIEQKWLQVMGIEQENGIIKRIYDFTCVTGFLAIGNNQSVTELSGNIVSLVTGGNPEQKGNYVLSADAQVYNVTGDYGTKFFQKDTLQQYDVVTAIRDLYGDISYVLVTQRYQKGTKIYYNIGRKYDTVNQVTTRVPDAEGYYVFDTLCDGVRQKVKTKSKEIATIIDKQYAPFAALKVKDGIVKAAYAAASAYPGGTKVANYNYVGKMDGDTFNTYYYTNDGEIKWQAATFKKAKNCKIYSVSENYEKSYGEKTKLELHDQIQGFAANEDQEVVAIYVLARKIDGPIYWPVDRQFDSTKLETTRTPDEEGWYYVDLFRSGEIKTYKTKEKAIINRVDSYSVGFAMETKGDTIVMAGAASSSLKYGGVVANGLDVTKVADKKVTAERTRPTATDYGLKQELQLAKDCKIYDVSPYAEQLGATTQLQVGDQIVGYTNKDGKVCELYVMYKNTHKDGAVSRCPHCDQDVFWQPYLGVIYEGSDHYYMASDFLAGQTSVGKNGDDKTWDVVLDLNGKTLSSHGRNFLIYDKMTIMDLAGGGKLEAPGVDGWANNLLVLNGGELTLQNVTVKAAEDAKVATQGGLIYAQIGCVINIDGATLENGKTSGTGGAIYLLDSTLNFNSGVIQNCSATRGDGIYLADKAVANIAGGTILGSIEGSATCKLNLSGAPKLSSLVMPNQVKLTLGQLTEGAEITVAANGIFTEASENAADYADYFKPALGHSQIQVVENALSTSVDMTISNDPLTFQGDTQDAWCSVCHKLVTWTPIDGSEPFVQMLDGHYYLAKDIAVNAENNGKDGYLYVSGGSALGSVCLHLNDHDLIVSGHRAIMGGARPLNVMGNGTVSGVSVKIGASGSAIHINSGKGVGKVNLYGGTYTKDASDTVSSILYVGYNGGTLNIYDGVLVDATGKTASAGAAGVLVQGGNTDIQGPAFFNMYGGEIRGGTSTSGGGNLRLTNQYATANIYGGTITGGSAPEGGNIWCQGGTLLFKGSDEQNIVISNGAATNGEGGNLKTKDAKPMQLQNVSFLGGTATSHGGNISIMRVPTTIEGNTLIDGGNSKTYGGALRVYQATVTMNGGEIKGGSAASEGCHNVWLAGSVASPAVFRMNGGKVYATTGYGNPGSAIFAYSNAKVYLAGNATVEDGENKAAGLRISATSKLYICDGWSGSANVRFATIYNSNTVVPVENGQVVTLDESLNETVGGSFTGTLHQLAGSVLNVVAQPDGSLITKLLQ